jgi:hypothetical protein
MFQKGDLMPPGFNSPETLFSCYGPMLFIFNGFFIKLIGANIFASKIGGVISGNLSVLLLFFTLRKKLGNRISLICCGYLVIIYLYPTYLWLCTFWNRPDPYILFFISLGLLCATGGKKLTAIIVSGLALGAVVNLKIIEGFYFIPIYVLLYLRYGIREAITSLIIAVGASIFPFVLFKNLSLQNYIISLGILAKQGLVVKIFIENMAYVFSVMLLPLLFLIVLIFTVSIKNMKKVYRENKLYILALFISTITVAVFASKVGSGINSVIPVALLSAYSLSFFYEYAGDKKIFLENNSTGFILTVSLWVIISVAVYPILGKEVKLIKRFNKKSIRATDVASDINKIMKEYKGSSIEMGYGGNYSSTLLRPLLVFANNHYLIDPCSLMDRGAAGLTISKETISYLAKCKNTIFLIPKGGRPFEIYSFLDYNQLFSEEFKKAFFVNYELKEQTKYFDIWRCR